MEKVKSFFGNNLTKVLAAVVLLLLFFLVPTSVNPYIMKVINLGLIYFVAVAGLCVILGMGGQPTFSTAGMMGLGAYTVALLTTLKGWSPVPALIVAVLWVSVFSIFMGLALFRLKGSYFSFASIGFTSLIFTVLTNWLDLTGGPDGIKNIPRLGIGEFVCKNYYDYFRVLFIIALVCYLIIQRIRKSYLGRALGCVRDNEIAAQCMGINAYRTKVISFIIAGAFAAFAGGLYALHERYISPAPFQYDQSAIYLIMIMLGGVNSTGGALIGSLFMTWLPERIRFLASYSRLIYGIGVIILMNVMPMGIMGMIDNLRYKLRKKLKKAKTPDEPAAKEAK
ncbi:MAG: branched-chain amino acid ABC transporter permease [Erysipelotrichales bacterium]|nr:branched-chain amino acid ABC transporter permease [Erysipelotrichales bacterium]MBQ4375618.1 branched-chain amino acid ABC transporter permease [Erysipelotrichales bacterium]